MNKKSVLITVVMVCVWSLMVVGSAEGATITVRADGSGDYPTIQAAIDDTNDGDEIICEDGVYTGEGNRDIDFRGKAITLKSKNGPENCIIDCNGTEIEPHRGFYFHTSETPNSVLDGFTITNGYAGSRGGGIYCYSGTTVSDGPTITNCIFSENSSGGTGGGIECRRSNMMISNCTFNNNSAGGSWGGGIYYSVGNPTLTNCTFRENSAVFGGAISYTGGSFPTVASPTLTNCTFIGNLAQSRGGAIFSYSGNPILTNCTFAENTAPSGNALAADTLGASKVVQILNCILWDGGNEINAGVTMVVAYSDVHGGWVGEGNINTDPFFVDPCNGDYHLLEGSACINAGDPNYIPEPNETDLDGNPRVLNGRIDMGAYEYQGLENTEPVGCIVGGDRAVEADSNCEGWVMLDGSCSSDADSTEGTNDDINDFDWYVVDACDPSFEDYLGSGEVIECNLPLGENIIVLEVTDTAGAFDSNEVTITVEDVTGPELSLTVEPNVLWPPNHKMVLITVEWEVSDNCDEWPEVRLVGITSSEDDDGKGDGATSDDIVIGEDGSIYLRAESVGYLEGRVYTITYEAVDDSGNATIGSAEVVVPDGYRWRHLEHKGEREEAEE